MERLELRRLRRKHLLLLHLATWIGASLLLLAVNLLASRLLMTWSVWPISIWAAVLLLHGVQIVLWGGRRRSQTDPRPDEELPALDNARAPDPGRDLEELRSRLFSSSGATREALRASPEIVAEVARGESHALLMVSWLDEAQRLLHRVNDHHDLRQDVAAALSRPESRAIRPALQKLLVQLDAREVKLAALEREVSERRSLLESFFLILESATMAKATDGVLAALSGTLRERVDLLEAVVAPREKAALSPVEGRETRRIRREVGLARDLQRSLLPRSAPQVEGLSVAFLYRPCREVGGDFFDFYEVSPHRLLIAVGDASGHGLDSSMISSMAKSALYTQVASDRSLEESMSEMNRMMCDTLSSRRLMTFILAELDTGRRTLSWVNAGQVFPFLRRGNEIRELEQPSYPLGVRNDTVYHRTEHPLLPGDVLLLLTDGYVEAVNNEGLDFGWDRLARRLLALEDTDTQRLVGALSEDLSDHLGGARQQDDVTLVAVRFDP